MRLLFLDQFSDSGGAQLCLGELLPEVRDCGWSASLLAPLGGALHARAQECGVRTADFPLRAYTNGTKSLGDAIQFAFDSIRCRRAVEQAGADVVYVNGPRALPAVIGLDVPVLFHSHSVLNKAYSRWIARVALRRKNARILAASDYLAAPLRRMLGAQRVQVIYNGVPDRGFGAPRTDGLAVRIGIVGRIAPEKGQLDFLRAAQVLAGRSLEFVIVGRAMYSAAGYEEEVRRAGSALGVEFAGWSDDPAEIYRRLDILAVPSAEFDANPRVIMEAMSAGVCVAAYRSGGIPELITHGEDGFITDHTPDAMAAAIEVLALNPELRQRIRRSARQTYEKRFTVRRYQREVCDAIALLAGEPGRASSESHSPAREALRAGDTEASGQ